MDKYDEMFDELDREFDPYAEDEDTLDKIFDELDEYDKETDALYGVPIRSTKGDVRNLRRVQTGEYWKNAEQIAYPVNNEKVQEYLKNKDDKPFVFPKMVFLTFVGLLALFGMVHGISNFFRTAAEEASKNYANVITVDTEETSQNNTNVITADEAKKTELKSGTTYLTEDKQFEFTYDDGKFSGKEGITIKGYQGNATDVTLPKDIQGYHVIDVQRSTFEGNNSIEKVIIESEITGIGFRDCAALKEVIFPATVNELGQGTFYNAPMMENITVDKGCFVNDDYAFNAAPTINYVEMTEGVGDNTQIAMVNGHNYYTADGQFQFQFENETIKLRKYMGDSTETTVPKEIQGYPVTTIMRSTFQGNNAIEKVIIEAEIASGGDIFRDCERLKEVVFPVTLEKLGYLSFCNTPALQAVTVSRNCDVDNEFVLYPTKPEVKYCD